jgi:hypothetical protein
MSARTRLQQLQQCILWVLQIKQWLLSDAEHQQINQSTELKLIYMYISTLYPKRILPSITCIYTSYIYNVIPKNTIVAFFSGISCIVHCVTTASIRGLRDGWDNFNISTTDAEDETDYSHKQWHKPRLRLSLSSGVLEWGRTDWRIVLLYQY